VITVRLMGGLGNQMFQFATGRHLALRRGVPLRLDTSWFGNQAAGDTERSYALEPFVADLHAIKQPVERPQPRTRWELARERVAERLGQRPNVMRQRGNGFDPSILDAPDGSHLIGYWQSAKYFEDVADVIRADFRLRVPLGDEAQSIAGELQRASDSVSLHVRRGDYVHNPRAREYHGIQGSDYYARGVDAIERHVGRSLQLFVFSDDPDWCERELKLGHSTTVVRGTRDYEDLILMSCCDHHVIANSSFSWWGAWLNDRPDATVVAPVRWARGSRDFEDVYLPSWRRL
jgi:hypothetical protein